jgi:hypothetical protein
MGRPRLASKRSPAPLATSSSRAFGNLTRTDRLTKPSRRSCRGPSAPTCQTVDCRVCLRDARLSVKRLDDGREPRLSLVYGLCHRPALNWPSRSFISHQCRDSAFVSYLTLMPD